MSNERKYWEFSFDINQELLSKVYRKTNSTYAYKEIERYLFKHGFDNKEDKQGSCYFTSEEIQYSKVDVIISDMFKVFPWLSECIEKAALYERPENYNYKDYCEELNKTKEHKKELENYYKKHNMEMPIELKIKLAERSKKGSKKRIENIHQR